MKPDYTIFDLLIENNVRFALYRLAWQKNINLILQAPGNNVPLSDLKNLNGKEGFVIAPFHATADEPVVLIRPGIFLKGENEIFTYLSNRKFEKKASHTSHRDVLPADYSFAHYDSAYKTFHSTVASGKLCKLVLSRTLDVKRENSFSAGTTFFKACEKYEPNFVFLCNTPETGAWMGVSPELLVSEQNGIYKTVALAGTKKIAVPHWDDKNRKEQQIVVDYMQQQLNETGADITQKGPFTVQAGAIEHLKTKFSFRLKKDYQIGDLLYLLHPSPAVCGFPKDEAFDFILKNEPHHRRYYSGFVGPLNVDGGSRLYVNLRCMQIGRNLLHLYAGGGILPSSEMKAEWEETENKLQTLLSVIN